LIILNILVADSLAEDIEGKLAAFYPAMRAPTNII
jgi:hypothetical protein